MRIAGSTLKPISPMQQRVLSWAAERPDHSNRLPFRLGKTEEGEDGIFVRPEYPFLDSARMLPDEQFSELVAQGHTSHTLDSNQRQILFAFSCSTLEPSWCDYGYNLIPYIVIDAVDLEVADTIGTFGVRLECHRGVMEDARVTGPELSEATRQFLLAEGCDPGRVYTRRKELTDEGLNLFGRSYVNLKVEEDYRNRGGENFYGIGQILMTTAMRIAAEQFLCKAYLMNVAGGEGSSQSRKLCSYYMRYLGARRSAKFPTYAFTERLIVSFKGEDGFQRVEAVLEQRRREAMMMD